MRQPNRFSTNGVSDEKHTAGKTFEGITKYNASFYESLVRMVREKLTQERDMAIMAQFRSLGIGKAVRSACRSETAYEKRGCSNENHRGFSTISNR